MTYFPDKDPNWDKIEPETAGFDSNKLKEAVDFAIAGKTDWDSDIVTPLTAKMAEPPPYNEIIGPIKEHGGPNGLLLREGRIVAEWGDTQRIDMTFSASKSYVAVCAGLAHDAGLIPDLHAPARELVDDGGFDPPNNHKITWHHLLQQTSEWEGTLFDKPDWIDRGRDVSIQGPQTQKGTKRELQEPGTYYEYNDVRVNRAALALLRVWKRSLPAVLKEYIMDPINASNTWEWHGYRNSYVEIDGQEIQSVSGGGHWGGGLFINSRDHARFGYLLLRKGNWNGNQLLSQNWIKQAITPSGPNPEYGYMLWLNTNKTLAPSLPESSFFARGAGANVVWIDPENDLVAVFRWILKEKIDEICRKFLQALN